MVERLDLNVVYALLDRCLAGRRMVATHPGLNAQMILEELALAWCAGGRAAASAPGMTGGS